MVDFYCAKWISRARTSEARRRFLLLSLFANLGVLFFFKYYNFTAENLSIALRAFGRPISIPFLKLALPVGLSFHTFQSIAYVVEVYRGKQRVENHFGIYALYVLFFPQLVAGPIERPQHLLHQLHELPPFNYDDAAKGSLLFLWGLFKKMVIADRLAIVVNEVFKNSTSYAGWPLIIGTAFFPIQIYCDFSGYSDMAIGLAGIFGVRLMTNFDRPYSAKSFGEFWRRWHISLSTWFRDYVFIPLGGSQSSSAKVRANLLITFLLSGLWHGANWTYVVWGLLNGLYLIVERTTAAKRFGIFLDQFTGHKFAELLRGTTGFFGISLSWIFFRSASLTQAAQIIRDLFRSLASKGPFEQLMWRLEALIAKPSELGHRSLLETRDALVWGKMAWTIVSSIWFVYFLVAYGLIKFEKHFGDREMPQVFFGRSRWVRWGFCLVILFSIWNLSADGSSPFIYFQF